MKFKLTQTLYPFVFFFIAVTLSNCKKDNVIVPNLESERLFGTWEWLGASGGFTGGTITPTSEGYTMTYEFDRSGVFKKYKDGKRTVKTNFKFVEGSTIFNSDISTMVEFEASDMVNRQVLEFKGSDTLVLLENCYDCYGHEFVRK